MKKKKTREGFCWGELNGVEGPMGLEPMTPCLKGRCSNQLSYGPGLLIATFPR